MSKDENIFVRDHEPYIAANGTAKVHFRNREGTVILNPAQNVGQKVRKMPIFIAYDDLTEEDRAKHDSPSVNSSANRLDPHDEEQAKVIRQRLIDRLGPEIVDFHDETIGDIKKVFEQPTMADVHKLREKVRKADKQQYTECVYALRTVDTYTYNHCLQLSILWSEAMRNIRDSQGTLIVRSKMDLSDDTILRGTTGALVHDFGKLLIDPKIMWKPGKLTEEEFAIVKKHTVIGVSALKKLGVDDSFVLSLVGNHHPGYLTYGDVQDPYQVIMSIVDIFDACTARRCYKPPFPVEKTLGIIKEEAQKYHWDEGLVRVLTKTTLPQFFKTVDQSKAV